MSKQDLTSQIRKILTDFPESRNSDIRLLIELWRRYYPSMIHEDPYLGMVIKVSDLFELPREDAIKRIRAGIQNREREFLPTDINVFIGRVRQSEEWLRFLGYRISKLPEAMTDTDIKSTLESYLSEPDQKPLFNL
jgi:hypothetical protein